MFLAEYYIITLWLVASAYAEIKPVYEDDPELYKVWKIPKDDAYWARYTDGAQWVGYLFAGRAEFPWIVDIRDPDQDQEYWSVGNLLDSLHVLTCCRCVMTYMKVRTFVGNNAYEDKLTGYLSKELKVSFAPTYLWEDYIPSYYKKIRPKPSQDVTFVANFKFTSQDEDRLVCYVGAYGRDWVNWKDHIAVDYKVRYRAYNEPMDTCNKAIKWLERNIDEAEAPYPHQVDITPHTNIKIDEDNTLCFTTRARVGTVCDHDRGAPLVCGGLVAGFVVRGARFQYCNNLLLMPFLVVKIGVASTYYEAAIDAYQHNLREWNYVEYSHSTELYHPRFYLTTFLIIIHLTKFLFVPP